MCRFLVPPSFLSSTAIALFGCTTFIVPASAFPAPTPDRPVQSRPIQISQSFRPPSRGLAPPTAGGATRGSSCLSGSQQLISLLPKSRIGLTHSSNPTLYWYVPRSRAKTARFLLLSQDASDVVYETTLILPDKPGIVSFKLPADAKPLLLGQRYQWFFVLRCNASGEGANSTAAGWLERVTPDAAISRQLQEANLEGRARIYAENGIWHEALTTLAQLRQTKPEDVNTIARWTELLKSVNLDAIVTEPLLEVPVSQE